MVFSATFHVLLMQRSKKRAADKKRRERRKMEENIANQGIPNDELMEDNSQLGRDDLTVECPRLFPYQALVDATNNFCRDHYVGIDRLGVTFVKQILDTNEAFIIRQLHELTYATVDDFVNEVLLLSQVNHPNITKLVGYSYKHSEKFLLYEHPSHGSLVNHLYGQQRCLDWKRMMEIALGVLRGLEYLQTRTPPLLHLHIEPANIWLDNDFTPKLSASGVYMMYHSPTEPGCSYETVGSYYYGRHDKILNNGITTQTDIYGFGILMLEMITGRKGMFCVGDGRAQFLTNWVQPYLKDKKPIYEMIDPKLQGKVGKKELINALSIAAECIDDQLSKRPLIRDLVERMNHLCSM